MAKFHEITRYINKYESLSSHNLIHILYLIDWKSCLELNKQMTSINWNSNNGKLSMMIINDSYLYDDKSKLSEDEVGVLKYVKNACKGLTRTGLSKLVYSTYPLYMGELNANSDLVYLSYKYKSLNLEN